MVASNNPYGLPPMPGMPQGWQGPNGQLAASSIPGLSQIGQFDPQMLAQANARPQMPQGFQAPSATFGPPPAMPDRTQFGGAAYGPMNPYSMTNAQAPAGFQGPSPMLAQGLPGLGQLNVMDPAMLAAANQRPAMNAQGAPGMMPQMPMQPFGPLAGSQRGQGQGTMQRRQQMPTQARGRALGFQRTRGY